MEHDFYIFITLNAHFSRSNSPSRSFAFFATAAGAAARMGEKAASELSSSSNAQ
jgi:hypothetical protein